MKRLCAMNAVRTIALSAASILLFLACEQPFKAGLGTVVDIRPPNVSLESPNAGDYLSGRVRFYGAADDDYKLDGVYVKITNHPQITDPKFAIGAVYFPGYQRATMDIKGNNARWEIEIDTTQFPDGDFKIQVMARDSVGQTNETNEVAFFIKNDPPAISLASPYVALGQEAGNAGGQHLNYGGDDTFTLPTDPKLYFRQLDRGAFIAGTVMDSEDIYTGSPDAANNRFPPQIRIWRVSDIEDEDISDYQSKTFRSGVYPSEDEGTGVPWESFPYRKGNELEERLFMLGVGNYQFIRDLFNEPGSYYAFEVRAQSKDGKMMFHYPRDCWPDPEINWDNDADPFVRENRAVIFHVRAPKEFPVIDLWGLEDIFGHWDPAAGGYGSYGNLKKGEDELNDNVPHPYVNKTLVNKNGSFTLRVKSSHSEGISTAEVYWERDDNRAERGRFIWDLANEAPLGADAFDWPGGGSPQTNGNLVSSELDYSYWGFRDPHSRQDGYYASRSFIFTYQHDGVNKVPSDSTIHPLVRGKSKIQKYTGNEDTWKNGKASGIWPSRTGDTDWKDMDDNLEEGLYNLEIYTRSAYGTAITSPFTCEVRLDGQPPEVEVTSVEGAYDLDLEGTTIVNGLVRPHMRFSDSRTTDSGLRPANHQYYQRDTGTYGYEQRYILVDKAQISRFEEQITKNWWPPLPDVGADKLEMNGVTWYKHGPIFDSQFTFKTSPILIEPGDYDAEPKEAWYTREPDALRNGEYRLYVFARDNAFNVGYTAHNIKVDHTTDRPQFDFSVGSIDERVTQPDKEYDVGGESFNPDSPESFWVDHYRPRNVFGPNSSIRVRITDDDSLDLGVAGDDPLGKSGIKISFAGMTAEYDEYIDPFANNPHNMILSDDQVKTIFAPQSTDSFGIRRAVKERTGDIRQNRLLSLLIDRAKIVPAYAELFPNPEDSYNSLPDGIYRISIRIADDPGLKLKLNPSDDPATAAENAVTFWFAVDTESPTAEDISPASGYISEGMTLFSGKVSDQNGPIRVYYRYPDAGEVRELGPDVPIQGFTVTDAQERLLASWNPEDHTDTSQGSTENTALGRHLGGDPIVTLGPVSLSDPTPGIEHWESTFTAPVTLDLKGSSGSFIIRLVMQDRFGNTVTITRNYSVDQEKPTVGMKKPVDTFARDAWDVTMSDGTAVLAGSDGENNKTRLANGVLSFNLSATDNFKVEGVRWWLLPADMSITIPSHLGELSSGETLQDALFNYHFIGGALPVNSIDKNLTPIESSNTQYIDTRGYPDGEYAIYAVAVDSAGNLSENPLLQTFFILQDQDKPYFGAITPAEIFDETGISQGKMVIGGSASDLTIRGTVYEDDGFAAPNGDIMPDSIRIWVNNNGGPGAGFNINNQATWTGYTAVTPLPDNSIFRMGKNITLSVGLSGYFSGDGLKSYIIEAADSWYGKFIDENGTPANGSNGTNNERVSRRRLFSFVLDTQPPEIKLTNPNPADGEPTFGDKWDLPAPLSANLKGTMKDVNLQTLADNHYYFRYRIDDSDEFDFDLNGYITDPLPETTGTPGESEVTVTFDIPANDVNQMFTAAGKGFTDLAEGYHTLMLIAQDKSGKEDVATLTFIKDINPPEFEFINIDATENGPVLPTDWWTDPPADADRRAWIVGAENVSVIYNDGNNIPYITGTFTDEISNIDTSSFVYRIDGGAPIVYPDTAWTGSGKSVRWTVYLTDDSTTGGTILPDGLHSISFRVSDTAGRELNDGNMYAFRIASRAPLAEVATQGYVFGAPATDNSTVFSINGWAASPSLDKVHLIIRRGNNSLYETDTTLAGLSKEEWTFVTDVAFPGAIVEHLEWEVNITRADLLNPQNGSLEEGDYELSVIAIDQFGTPSDEFLWEFIIDNTPPVIAINDITVESDGNRTPTAGQAYVFMGTNPRIQGSVSDQHSFLKTVERQIRKYVYAGGSWQYYDFDNDDWTGTADSWETLAIPANSPEYTLQWALTELEDFTDGYYSVRLRVKDVSLTTGAAEGWAAANNGNPHISDYYYFFIDRTPPTLAYTDNVGSFSTRIIDGGLMPTISGISESPIGFDKLELELRPLNAAGAVINRSITPGSVSTTWNWSFNSIPLPPAAYSDGTYRITFTVTDMAGRQTTKYRDITLDNTPPTARIEFPRLAGPFGTLHPYASDTIYGGEATVINGTSDDKGPGGSASGVAAIWYFLGYTGTGAPGMANLTEAGWAAEETAVKNTVLPAGTIDGSPASHTAFDAAAADLNTRWFKYTLDKDSSNNDYPVPDGFSMGAAIDLYNWELKVDGSAFKTGGGYTSDDFPVKTGGTQFNSAVNGWLVKEISPVGLPTAIAKDGLYSMPLWIRVADTAGNVSYFCRDIWIYPDGDRPAAAIINPAANTGPDSPRGGTISIDGMSSDNIAVQSVIYRIKVDNNPDPTTPTNGGTVIEPNAGTRVPADAHELELMSDAGGLSGNYASYLLEGGWYYANLEGTQGSPSIPWSFMVNANDEVKARIGDLGFTYNGSTPPKQMIRVWVEVLVFDREFTDDLVASNMISKLISRVFYLQDSAPEIKEPRISKIDAVNFSADDQYGAYTSGFVRSGQFALKANLIGNNPISQISVKRSGAEGAESGWLTAYNNGTAYTIPGFSFTAIAGDQTTMTYQFDSLIENSTTAWASVYGGSYAASGGKFTVDVRIRDNQSPPGEASYTFEVGIDNFAPVADEDNLITPKKVAGTSVAFIGRVFDYRGLTRTPLPEYRGIDRVIAWFTKDQNGEGRYVNLNSKMDTQAPGAVNIQTMQARDGRTASITYDPDGKNNEVTGIDITGPGTLRDIRYPGNSAYVKIISEANAGPLENRMTWQPSGSHDILWNFMADTTFMPDGWIYLNYLVIDDAGNASYYQQRMVVMNNYPKIDAVTIWTSNIGEGAAFSQKFGDEDDVSYSTYRVRYDSSANMVGYYSDELEKSSGNGNLNHDRGYLNSGFIAKNQTVGFGVDTLSGNAPLHYRAQYVERVLIELSHDNLVAMANKNYAAVSGLLNGTGSPIMLGAGGVNLYTIADKGNVDDYTWAVLGVQVNPTAGAHFVFKADDETVKSLGFNGTVWGYRQVGAITEESLNHSSPTSVDAEALSFVGSDYFGSGTGRIHEFKGSQPDAIDVPSGMESTEAATNGTYNNPHVTAYFLIKVWDTVNDILPSAGTAGGYNEEDMLYDAVVIGMNVFLYDTTPPTVRLYDLNPYTETYVEGNNIGPDNQLHTLEAAADPTAIGTNIRRGGLYNIGTEREVIKSGYIDPYNGTEALRPWVQDTISEEWGQVNAMGYDPQLAVLDSNAGSHINDKVSGKIILRGQAWDDQLLDTITITISSAAGSTTRTILQLRESDGTMMVPSASAAQGVQAWARSKLHWKTGHVVEWAYVWDTEKIPNADGLPAADVQITATAKDKKGSDPPTAVNPAGLTSATVNRSGTLVDGRYVHYNRTNVDMVPYITGMKRQTKYATKRSRQGWYSFFRGEQGVSILGYNFGKGTGGTLSLTMKESDVKDHMLTPVYNHEADDDAFKVPAYTFDIPGDVSSSRIDFSVSGTLAYNHTSNHTDKSWNREYHSYTAGSDLWVNKPYAHIWRSLHDNTVPRTFFGTSAGNVNGLNAQGNDDGFGLTRPSMALEYTGTNAGRLLGAWAVYGKATVYAGYNEGAPGTAREGGNTLPTEPYVGPDVSLYNGGTSSAIVYVYEADGSATVRINNNLATTGTNVQNATSSTPTRRFQNNRVLRSAGNSHAVTYDAVPSNLLYARSTTANNNFKIDGGSATANIGGIAASIDAGLFSAIDYDSTGVVIAYYDSANDTLRIALGNGEAPSAATAWTRQYVLPNDSSPAGKLFRGSGRYVSIKVDKNNKIHLSFYNTTYNTLVYARGSRSGTTWTLEEAVTVDNVVRGGVWSDISVDDNGNPFIVYGDTARIGNYDGMRLAYKSAGAFTRPLNDPVTGTAITGWEAVTVPSDYTVNNDRLQIEAWPPTVRGGALATRPNSGEGELNSWSAVVGYGSDRFRLAYFYLPNDDIMSP